MNDTPFITPPPEPLTDAQLEDIRARWRAAQGIQAMLRTPLPRRVRFQIAWKQRVTDIGIWLCDHKMWWAADILWWRR